MPVAVCFSFAFLCMHPLLHLLHPAILHFFKTCPKSFTPSAILSPRHPSPSHPITLLPHHTHTRTPSHSPSCCQYSWPCSWVSLSCQGAPSRSWTPRGQRRAGQVALSQGIHCHSPPGLEGEWREWGVSGREWGEVMSTEIEWEWVRSRLEWRNWVWVYEWKWRGIGRECGVKWWSGGSEDGMWSGLEWRKWVEVHEKEWRGIGSECGVVMSKWNEWS